MTLVRSENELPSVRRSARGAAIAIINAEWENPLSWKAGPGPRGLLHHLESVQCC